MSSRKTSSSSNIENKPLKPPTKKAASTSTSTITTSSSSTSTITTKPKSTKRDIHTPSDELLAYLKLVEKIEELATTRQWKKSSSKTVKKVSSLDELYIKYDEARLEQLERELINENTGNNNIKPTTNIPTKQKSNDTTPTPLSLPPTVKIEKQTSTIPKPSDDITSQPLLPTVKVEKPTTTISKPKPDDTIPTPQPPTVKKEATIAAPPTAVVVEKKKRLSNHLKDLKRLSISNGNILDYLSNATLSGAPQTTEKYSTPVKQQQQQTDSILKTPTLNSIIEDDEGEDEDVEFIVLNSAKKRNKLNNKFFVPDEDEEEGQQQPPHKPSPAKQPIKKQPSPIKPPTIEKPKTTQTTDVIIKQEKEKQDKKDQDKILEQFKKVTITPKKQETTSTKIPPIKTEQPVQQPQPPTISIQTLTKEFKLTNIQDQPTTTTKTTTITGTTKKKSTTTTEEQTSPQQVKSFYPIEINNDKFNESVMCSPLNMDTAHLPGVSQYFERDKKIHAISYFKRYNATVFQNKFSEDMIVWSDEQIATPGKTSISKKNDINLSKIILSTKLITSIKTLANVLCHEMCHAATWMFNNCKKAHSSEFKFWARIAQSLYPELSIDMCDNFKSSFAYHYKCQSLDCTISFGRTEPLLDKLYCGKCHSPIIPIEKVESETSRFEQFFNENHSSIVVKYPHLQGAELKSVVQLKWRRAEIEKEKQKKKDKMLQKMLMI